MFVLLGSNGQITSQLSRRLLAGRHPIRIVGRDAQALATLRDAGAEIAIGDPSDTAFLERAFAGATAAYTMTPPCYGEPDMLAAQARIGEAVAQALHRGRIRRVVNLSSVGAELPAGTGPIVALHDQEQRLDGIDGIDLLHIRPAYFMDNFLTGAASVSAGGPLAGMEAPDVPIPMVATRDVAAVIAGELTAPQRTGVLLLQASTSLSMRTAASILGAAVGNPALQYLQVDAADMKAGLRAAGLSLDAADRLEELARWLSTTAAASAAAGPVELQPTTLERFARDVFAPACRTFADASTRSSALTPTSLVSVATNRVPITRSECL